MVECHRVPCLVDVQRNLTAGGKDEIVNVDGLPHHLPGLEQKSSQAANVNRGFDTTAQQLFLAQPPQHDFPIGLFHVLSQLRRADQVDLVDMVKGRNIYAFPLSSE